MCWLPAPGDLPDPGIEPGSLTLQDDSLPSESQGYLYIRYIGDYVSLYMLSLCIIVYENPVDR